MAKNVDISKSGFPNRLRRLREAKNVPVAELAEKAGVTDRTLRDIEAGKRPRVQTATIHSLAKALGVSYTELRYGSRLRRYALPSAVAALVVVAAGVVAYVAGPAERRTDSPSANRPRVTTSSREAYQHYVVADSALKKLNREEAKGHLRKALELDSTFVMACVRLTDSQIRGTPAEARLLIEQARRHSGKATDIERSYITSRAKYLANDVRGAIAELETLTVKHPKERDAWALMGHYYNELKQADAAISSFEKALAVDPRDATSWNSLAYARESVGDLDGALRACDEYIRACPYEHNPYDTRGDLLARHGRPDEAILAFKQALKLRPDFYPSTQFLGCIYLLQRDYERALSCFKDLTLAKDVGARSRGRFYTAAVSLHQGKLEDAMTALNRGMAEDRLDRCVGPAFHHKLVSKSDILMELGDAEDAVAHSELMLENVREDGSSSMPEWLDDHVRILARAGRFDEAGAALDSCETAVAEGHGHANSYYWMARGWFDFYRGDYASACSAFEQVRGPDSEFLHGYYLGLAYMKAGRVDEAVGIFEKIAKRYRDDRAAYVIEAAKFYYYLGVAYEETGRRHEAAKMYREFLETWKDADPVFDGMKADAWKRLSRITA